MKRARTRSSMHMPYYYYTCEEFKDYSGRSLIHTYILSGATRWAYSSSQVPRFICLLGEELVAAK
eukprot:4349539-Pleurochrysis_carterae.AAC.4